MPEKLFVTYGREVTIYAVTDIRWLQIDAVWNYGGISLVSVWLNHGTNFPVMLSQHLQPTHSRTDSTRCRVGHYKAEASMPDIYKYKYKYWHWEPIHVDVAASVSHLQSGNMTHQRAPDAHQQDSLQHRDQCTGRKQLNVQIPKTGKIPFASLRAEVAV